MPCSSGIIREVLPEMHEMEIIFLKHIIFLKSCNSVFFVVRRLIHIYIERFIGSF